MIRPSIPENEAARLEDLQKLRILNTPPEERFDRITRLAQRLFNVPIAVVSLVDKDRKWFESILGKDTFVIEDAQKDPRFINNPLVVNTPKIRFYAGQSLMGLDGHKIGMLYIIDFRPHVFSSEEAQVLKDLAALVEKELLSVTLAQAQNLLIAELETAKHQALLDHLTGCWNRKGIEEILRREIVRAKRMGASLGIALVDIDRFKSINDTYGHPVGDEVIKEFAQRLRFCVREYDAVGRYGGEEFLVVMPDCGINAIDTIGNRILERMRDDQAISQGKKVLATASIGAASFRLRENMGIESLIVKVDQYLYQAKNNGRNQMVC